jgi:tetratricopeptide (TPR) repeat protein
MHRRPGRRSSKRTLLAALALAFALSGCGHAYRQALARGDAFARVGDWDAAAASYEHALRIEPDGEEAALRLRQARHGQSALRVVKSRELLAQGELGHAVRAAHHAVMLEPENPEARAAYVEARAAVLGRADALLGEDKGQDALDLVRVVRQLDPRDREAADLEGRILTHMASGAYDRALAFLAKNRRGNALLALREVEAARPGYRDAAARAQEVRRSLEDELRFVLVVEPAGDGEKSSLRARVDDELLHMEPDTRFRLLAETSKMPSNGVQGVRIWPGLGAIQRAHDVQTIARSCDYVCGTDRIPNPAYDVEKRRVEESQMQMASSEGEIKRARKAADQARRDLMQGQAAYEARKADMDKARADLDRCYGQRKLGTECKAEEDRYEEARRGRDLASNKVDDLRVLDMRARTALDEAVDEKERARKQWERSLAMLKTTDPTVVVDRMCKHNYGVELHSFTAEVPLSLRAQVLGDPAPVDLPKENLVTRNSDEAFPAESGRCAEVAAGDPLVPPTDAQVEIALTAQVVGEVQSHLATWYETYVDSYRTEYEADKAAGKLEEANEAYVRYMLLGPGLP